MSLPRVTYPVCPCCVLPPPASIPKLLGHGRSPAPALPCPGALGASSQPCPKGKGSGMQGS